jgi:hypothetical protein
MRAGAGSHKGLPSTGRGKAIHPSYRPASDQDRLTRREAPTRACYSGGAALIAIADDSTP